jgi:hypothetical protein
MAINFPSFVGHCYAVDEYMPFLQHQELSTQQIATITGSLLIVKQTQDVAMK